MANNEIIDRPRYLTDHLTDLRKGLVRSLVVAVLGVAVAFWKSNLLFDFLLHPFKTVLSKFPAIGNQVHALQTLTPVEAFMINMKLAAIAGVILASPYILAEIWKFAAPALKAHERNGILMVFCLGLFFFLGGIAFAYFFVVPVSLEFLMKYNLDFDFVPQWTLQGYYGFVVNFLLIFGCVFELPLVLAALVAIGIATPEFLRQKRKYAILGIFILAAFLAPSADPITQTIVAVPLMVLYEIGILLSYLTVRRKNN
ncbi:MAG TPA: twin-arginine translocase subunit TatC [bacterium]|nr:twin-arginine translocase subunit TatC [bacterium]